MNSLSADEMKVRFQRWRGSFLAFLFECVVTTDEGRGVQDRIPAFRYLIEAYSAIESNKVTVIVKSRQLLFTHFMAGYYLWLLLFRENQRLGVMNQNEDDAADLLETRIVPLYERLPSGYPWPKLKVKRLTIVNEVNNSRIVATSSVANKTRGKTYSRVWLDEYGFQDNQKATLKAALPATKGEAAKLIIVSTPAMGDVYEELGRKELDPEFEVVEVMTGVKEYRNTRGHCVLYVHHTAHPERRSQEYIDGVIKEEGEEAYEIEYNLKWRVVEGKAVFKGFDRTFFTRDYQRLRNTGRRVLHEGWDFGGHHPSWVVAEQDSVGRLVVHKAVLGVDIDIYEFMDLVEEIRERDFGGYDFKLYCDPAGASMNGQGTAAPAAEILRKRFGRRVMYIRSHPYERVRAMKQLMRKVVDGAPGLVLHPMLGDVYETAQMDQPLESGRMLDGFDGELVYEKIRGMVDAHKLNYKKDKFHEHWFDAFGYMFICLYPGLMPVSFEERFRKQEQLTELKRSHEAQRRKKRVLRR